VAPVTAVAEQMHQGHSKEGRDPKKIAIDKQSEQEQAGQQRQGRNISKLQAGNRHFNGMRP